MFHADLNGDFADDWLLSGFPMIKVAMYSLFGRSNADSSLEAAEAAEVVYIHPVRRTSSFREFVLGSRVSMLCRYFQVMVDELPDLVSEPQPLTLLEFHQQRILRLRGSKSLFHGAVVSSEQFRHHGDTCYFWIPLHRLQGFTQDHFPVVHRASASRCAF